MKEGIQNMHIIQNQMKQGTKTYLDTKGQLIK